MEKKLPAAIEVNSLRTILWLLEWLAREAVSDRQISDLPQRFAFALSIGVRVLNQTDLERKLRRVAP